MSIKMPEDPAPFPENEYEIRQTAGRGWTNEEIKTYIDQYPHRASHEYTMVETPYWLVVHVELSPKSSDEADAVFGQVFEPRFEKTVKDCAREYDGEVDRLELFSAAIRFDKGYGVPAFRCGRDIRLKLRDGDRVLDYMTTTFTRVVSKDPSGNPRPLNELARKRTHLPSVRPFNIPQAVSRLLAPFPDDDFEIGGEAYLRVIDLYQLQAAICCPEGSTWAPRKKLSAYNTVVHHAKPHAAISVVNELVFEICEGLIGAEGSTNRQLPRDKVLKALAQDFVWSIFKDNLWDDHLGLRIIAETMSADELNRKLQSPYTPDSPNISSIGVADTIMFLLEFHSMLYEKGRRNVIEFIRRYVTSNHYRESFRQPYRLAEKSLATSWARLRKTSIFHYLLRWQYPEFWPVSLGESFFEMAFVQVRSEYLQKMFLAHDYVAKYLNNLGYEFETLDLDVSSFDASDIHGPKTASNEILKAILTAS